MEKILSFAITLLVAAAGGWILKWLKVPAGAMVGAIAAVIVLNLSGAGATTFPFIKVVAQLVSGMLIGCRVSRRDIAQMRLIVVPLVILLCGMIILNLTSGLAIYRVSNLSLHTALFSTAPGGMSDMAIIASDFGANETHVAFLQLFRILLIFMIMPSTFSKLLPILKRNRTQSHTPPQADQPVVKVRPTVGSVCGLILCAAAGGLILHSLKVSAGAMIGSMIASAAFSITVKPIHPSSNIRVWAQILSGAFIGARVDAESLRSVPELLVPMLIMSVSVVFFTFAISFVMHRCSKLDLGTCLMACTPGGLQEMTLLSEELGADTPKIAVMQTIRLIFVILVFPIMLPLLGNIL